MQGWSQRQKKERHHQEEWRTVKRKLLARVKTF
uniref:Uncharacterized protein n=1 Tax=Anguilla anguilla TaxID=7936 RepID=A0A0E9QLT0_ANGAN